MTRNSKIFLITILVSLICLWGLNSIYRDLEDTFYWNEIAEILLKDLQKELFDWTLRAKRVMPIEEIRVLMGRVLGSGKE